MLRFLSAAAVVALVSAPAAHAQEACFKRQDLHWANPIAKAFDVIDTGHAGCITPEQIMAYRAALAADRRGQKDRIRAALAH